MLMKFFFLFQVSNEIKGSMLVITVVALNNVSEKFVHYKDVEFATSTNFFLVHLLSRAEPFCFLEAFRSNFEN